MESDGGKMTFTEAQKRAITYRNGSVLVSAGAGSGKTRVITERLMEYMDPQITDGKPKDIDRFLIITFTRAAASELRARIGSAIAERLYSDPGNAHLRRQMVLVRNAQIETIHSFCGKILREYAAQLGISPAFRILEDERKERMLAAALDRVLEQGYESENMNFLRLADSVGAGRDDSRLAELTLKLYNNMQSHTSPERWIAGQMEELLRKPNDIGETLWGRELLRETEEEIRFWANEMERSLRSMMGDRLVSRAYEASFRKTLEDLKNLEAATQKGWEATLACLPVSFPRIQSVKDPESKVLAERLKLRRQHCKDAMKKLQDRVFTGDSEKLLGVLSETAPEMQALLELCSRLEVEYWKSKQKGNYLDFSDLEHLSLKLLIDEKGKQTENAKKIADQFEEIMVDEYQDVSRIQDAIFHAVSRDESNLFFVGDIKQSIYRFRLADPGIFTEKSHRFEAGKNSRGDCLIHLQENFRSRKEILNAVNDVFGRCMSEQLGEINYDENEKLIQGTATQDSLNLPELLLLKRDPSSESALEDEAELVGEEILKMIGQASERQDKSPSELHFGDIAILLRSANTDGGVFRRKLLQMGIPVSAGSGGDFFNSVEVSTVYAMLQLVDNPHRDIPLLTVLKSPAFGFTPDQLSMIRAASPDTDYYAAMKTSTDDMAAGFIQKLKSLRKEAPDLDPVQMIERIIDGLDLYSIFGAMTDGEQRLQHLQDLIDMAEAFSQTDERGLHRLVQWLDNMRKKNYAPAGSSDGDDAVRILSIHKSKGLEFPVVFYSALGKQFNTQDITGIVLLHPILGLGPKRTDNKRKIEYPTIARQAIARRLSRELRSEEMRLMYVAMTRAKERLIMTACVKKPEEMLGEAEQMLEYDRIPAPLLLNASSPLPWLLPSAAQGKALQCQIRTRSQKMIEEEGERIQRRADADPETCRLLEHRLSFRYPFPHAEELPSKMTATGLDKRKAQDEDAVDLSRYRSGKPAFEPVPFGELNYRATEIGTAVHHVLQHINFERTKNIADIEKEISKMAVKGYLSEEAAGAVDPNMILQFFASETGKRILHAEQKWREFRFSLLCAAKDLIPGEDAEDQILLQGVIDCCFIENGELVVVDYKTDRVSEQEASHRAEHYRTQIEAYANALTRIMGLRVRERILFFLQPGIAVSL